MDSRIVAACRILSVTRFVEEMNDDPIACPRHTNDMGFLELFARSVACVTDVYLK
jgi:hypothetical protein